MRRPEYMDTADEDLDGTGEIDDDAMISPDGYPMMTPEFAESQMLETLEDPPEGDSEAELPPQEAYELMKYTAPVSQEESDILEETPFLDSRMRLVDDPDHDEAMIQSMRDEYKAMDNALEDQMYGEEEMIERAGTDSGFSLRPKKLLRGIRRGVRGVARGAVKAVSKVAKFVPGRDAKKAQLVKNLNVKLVREHANWLQAQDLKAGRRQSRAVYVNASRQWAKGKMASVGIPTSYTAGNQIATNILGDDVMGSWYNPFSWFAGKTKYVLMNTEGERLAEMNENEYQAYNGAKAAQLTSQNPNQDPNVDPNMEQLPEEQDMATTDESGKLYRSIHDPLDGLSGDEPPFEMVLGDASLQAIGDDDSSLGEFVTEILGRGNGRDESGLDDFLYKLNPAYWVKSSREKKFIASEHRSRNDEKDNAKFAAKREQELEYGKRALAAKQAAQAAIDRSSELERQLQDIEATTTSGGAEAARDGVEVANKTKRAATGLAAKLEAGEKLSPQDVTALKQCVKNCGRLQALHRSLHQGANTTSGYRENPGVRSSFLGNNERKRRLAKRAVQTSSGAAFPAPRGQKQWSQLVAVAAVSPKEVPTFLKKKGWKLDKNNLQNLRAMTQISRGLMKQEMAKKGKGLVAGDNVGLSWGGFARGLGKVAKVAALPITATAYLAYKGGKKIFGSKGPSAAQAQQNRIIAARRKYEASQRRIAAANATAAAEQQARSEEAAAADSEAAARDAETDAKAAPMDDGQYDEDTSDAQGDVRGKRKMRNRHKVFTAGDFIGSDMGYIIEKLPSEKDKKIVAEAAKETPMGKKVRAGATLYEAAKKGDPKAKLAIAKMQKKAKGGDVQAQRDLNAVKAGKVAAGAHGVSRAAKVLKAKNAAANKKGVAIREKVENSAGDRLARMSRKRQLAKIAQIEYQAAHGDRKAKAQIAAVAARAQKGDKKAKAQVAALMLAKNVRVASKNPREARNLRAAGKMVVSANRGNRNAIRQVRIIQAAAAKGQPNAKRAQQRLVLASHVERAVKTGKVVNTKSAVAVKAGRKTVDQKRYNILKSKVASGVATREEALAAAQIAHKYGAKNAAGNLAMQAKGLRSSSTGIKNAAAVAAAAQGGNKEAAGMINVALTKASEGNPAGINSAGNLAAVKALDDHKRGLPMSPEMAEATGIVVRARANDPEAKRIAERVGAAAQGGEPKAVEAAIALTAASAVIAATAARPKAQQEWVSKAKEARGMKLNSAETKQANEEFTGLYSKVQAGTATQPEAQRARHLAESLGKTKLVAEISALMPPVDTGDAMTSLPDAPQGEIRSLGQVVRESLKALLFATRDPIANYREGLRSRGATAALLPSVAAPKATARAAGEGNFEKAVSDAYKNQDSIDENRRKAARQQKPQARQQSQQASRANEMERELGTSASWGEGKF